MISADGAGVRAISWISSILRFLGRAVTLYDHHRIMSYQFATINWLDSGYL